ncbi:MAG: hypothetical protein MSIBF_06365 [Candidatus Altiarchaeales archaeon IMC4]|nr:MAG: hypothetical protein MSIBF_06365 [Candidatus Altiarchaeales archaeon IMC4]
MRVFVALLVFFVFAAGTCHAANIDPAVLDELTSKGEADVIITLKDGALPETICVEETNYKKSGLEKKKSMVMARQDGILSAVSTKGVAPDFELKHKYSVINAVSGKLTKSGFDKLKNRADVEAISLNGKVYAMLDESVPLINADDVWGLRVNGKNITGAGETVCIIDTGVDYNHTALGGCFGTGCKVLGGYDFVNNDADPMDDHGHGTHCAGIVASTNGTYRGVAPDANIVAVKVLNQGGVGSDATVIAGIDWCVSNATKFNISVISMSIGDGTLHSTYCNDSPETGAINSAIANGILVAVASGNNGSAYGVSSPACIENATSVGSSYVGSPYSALHWELFVTSDGNKKLQANPMEYSAVANASGALLYADLGYPENFTGQNFTGKIALIKRGTLTFAEKVQNAYNASAIGAIIFNKEAGNFQGTLNLTNNFEIPVVSISLEDGNYLLNLTNVTIDLSVTNVTLNESVLSFTNRNVLLDLLAPGENICSTKRGGGFEGKSGTSMATPHVAGAALLLNQYQKEMALNLTPRQIEDLFWETGAPVYDSSTTLMFSRVDVLAAINSLGGFSATSDFSASGKIDVFSLSVSTTAESFLNQTNCALVSKYDGGIQTHIKGTSNFNFNVTPGRGYYTYCPTNGSKTITGLPIENATIRLATGWNLIGSVDDGTGANALCGTLVKNCIAAAKYDNGFQIYPEVNFTISSGEGVFVYLTNASDWTG